ncbi:hemin transporter, partial [Fusobacterium animalis]
YKAFIVKGSVTKVAAGVEVDGRFIYNKDPITGKEEFGIVVGRQGLLGIDYSAKNITKAGKIIANYDWDVAAYEDKGKPIKDFQGFIGGAGIKVNLFGYQFNWGVSVGGNKADFGADVNLSDNRIKIGGSGGYVHVFEWKNPSEATKVLIRTIANDSEKIVNDKNVMGKLIDITRKIMKQRDVLK